MKKILLSFFSFLFVLGIGLGLSHLGVLKNAERVKAEESEFVMVEGASFRSYWSTPNCGITFGATITVPNNYVNNVRLFIAPYDFVETVANNQEPIPITDYIEAFNKYYNLTTEEQAKQPIENKYYTIVEPAKIPYTGGVSFLGGLKNIKNGNESRRFFGIYYYYDSNADKNEYAIMPNGEVGQARSIAYLASGHYNMVAEDDGIVSNDEYMTSFWMERAIKTAVSKSDKTVDISSISYIEGENKTATIKGGVLSGTYFDDFLTISGTIIQVGEDVIDVGQRLNFKVDYTNFSDYINQNDKKGHLINVTNTGSIVAESKIGRDTASYSLTINPYNLANAELSTLDITFTDTISLNGNDKIIDSYNNYTDITPSTTLIVPKGANMLAQKEIDSSLFTSIGSFSYWVSGNGANGDEIDDASTGIIVNGESTLAGNKNCINSITDTFNAIKNKFNLIVNYCWDDAYNAELDVPRVDGSTQANTQEKQYFYKQTHTWQQLTGYKTYLSLNRNNQADTILVQQSGTYTVYYAPETYNVTIKYDVIPNKHDPNDLPPSAPADTTLAVKYDYPYCVSTPVLNNYRAQSNVSGIMNNVNGITEPISYTRVHTEPWTVPFDSVGAIDNEDSRLWQAAFKDIGDSWVTKEKGYSTNMGDAEADMTNVGRNIINIINEESVTNRFIHDSSQPVKNLNYSCYYISWGGFNHFAYSETTSFYLEFEFKVTKRITDDNCKFGVLIEPRYNRIDASNGANVDQNESRDYIYFDVFDSANLENSAKLENVVRRQEKGAGGIADVLSVIGNAPYMTNDDNEFLKFSMWMDDEGTVTVSLNNIKVGSYTNVDYKQMCYFGIQGWNIEYEVRNALYRHVAGVTSGTGLDDSQRKHINYPTSNSKNGEYHSNTISDTDFYYETFITPTGFSNLNSQQGKVGIMLTSCEDKNNQVFFYANLWGEKGSDSEIARERQEIGMMTSEDGQWDVGSLADTTSKVLKIYENTLNVRKRYAIWKKGASIYFIFNETAYFVTYNQDLAGPCTVSLKTMNVVFSFDGSVQDADGSQFNEQLSNYDKIAQERGINEVVLDGDFINDTAWSQEGRSRMIEKNETDGNGRYFKFKAFLGKSFMYIAAEAKVNEIIKGDVFLDADATLSSNLQVDFRGSDAIARSGINGKSLHNGFAHVTFVEVGNGVIRMEAAIPYVVYSKQANSSAITSLIARFSFGACEESNVLGWDGASYEWWCDLKYYTVTGSGIQLDTMSE